MIIARHYEIYVTRYDTKACIVTVPSAIRCQLNHFLTNKRMSKDIIQIRMIIKNERY